jgi:hypothetical protein
MSWPDLVLASLFAFILMPSGFSSPQYRTAPYQQRDGNNGMAGASTGR